MRIGFCCAYTPLAIIDAAGCEPYRILPVTEAVDQAGRLIHDNMCPHVKRILDRAMQPDLPDLGGVIFVNSCDAMRRLADAWRLVRPGDRTVLLDLPATTGEASVRWWASELKRLCATLSQWTGRAVTDDDVRRAIARNDVLDSLLASLRARAYRACGGARAMQRIVNDVASRPVAASIERLSSLAGRPGDDGSTAGPGVPVLVFGNVMPEPETFDLLERCGARVVADDLCTGSRLLVAVGPVADGADPIESLARAALGRPACARTITTGRPGRIGADIADRARRAGARAAIAHVIKFCDPYLGRMPAIREALGREGLPLLVLEGDCTLRSVGQHATRIEAFMEMLTP